MHHPGLERSNHPMRTAQVVGPNACCQAVNRGIGQRDRLVFVIEGNNANNRAEHFFLRKVRTWIDIGENCRCDIRAACFAQDTPTTGHHARAIALRAVNFGEDGPALGLRRYGACGGAQVQRIAHNHGLRLGFEGIEEGLVNRPLHQQS
ncbi:MAG: Uncharacterised protein [Pseudidiomarina mangrovi]|nr:MAG: Uncharacterised protein [Pseudidiomarina mangrovi]